MKNTRARRLDAVPRSYRRRSFPRGYFSVGAWVIVLIAAVTTVAILARTVPKPRGLQYWTSARAHTVMYRPVMDDWNASHTPAVDLFLFSGDVLLRRTMSGFLSDVPVADCIEIERSYVGTVFAGPLEDVGFVDLTERLKREGLMDQFNAPSFSPWTTRGHIFGLPHDVHPVLLAYRADIVEAAGIDVSKIETWDDFAREMAPLTRDRGADGRPKRYPLNLWYTGLDQIEALILQAGGGLFDADGKPSLDSETNARVLAKIVSWTGGPNQIAADAPEFTASGNQLRYEGFVVCSITPDWLGGVWQNDIPLLKGKMKLMPLPAWEKGGRRTSVWGGTMLGIAKSSKHFDDAWAFAKQLYLDPRLARKLYDTNKIISPVKSMWSQSFYDEPDPFYSGQPTGRLYIQQAPNVPPRPSSPYYLLAKQRLQDVGIGLRNYAEANNAFDAEKLLPESRRLLHIANDSVSRQIQKNVFLSSTSAATSSAHKEQP